MVGAGEMIQPMLPLFIKGGWVAVPSFTMPPDKEFLVKAKRVKEGFEYSFIREEDYWVKDTLNYEYCTVMQPYAHQKDTVKFLVEHPRAFVFNGQGSGKSLSCLWAIDYLYKTQTLKKKVLIVAPLSTLQSVWGKEIFTHFFYYKFNLIRGTAEKRNTLINEQVHFNIINHDGLTNMIQRGDINPDHYDLIIYGAIKRCKDYYDLVSKVYPANKVILIDGNDEPEIDALYAKHLYFKRELQTSHPNLRPITFGIPTCKLATPNKTKTQDYATCIPGQPETYIFKSETPYYKDYQKSYYGVIYLINHHLELLLSLFSKFFYYFFNIIKYFFSVMRSSTYKKYFI